jgi:hypothetical protein
MNATRPGNELKRRHLCRTKTLWLPTIKSSTPNGDKTADRNSRQWARSGSSHPTSPSQRPMPCSYRSTRSIEQGTRSSLLVASRSCQHLQRVSPQAANALPREKNNTVRTTRAKAELRYNTQRLPPVTDALSCRSIVRVSYEASVPSACARPEGYSTLTYLGGLRAKPSRCLFLRQATTVGEDRHSKHA